jgi:hypothetical protein
VVLTTTALYNSLRTLVIQTKTIRDESEWKIWLDCRQRRHPSFNEDKPTVFPVLAIWIDTFDHDGDSETISEIMAKATLQEIIDDM